MKHNTESSSRLQEPGVIFCCGACFGQADTENAREIKVADRKSIKFALTRCVNLPMIASQRPRGSAYHPQLLYTGQMATSE